MTPSGLGHAGSGSLTRWSSSSRCGERQPARRPARSLIPSRPLWGSRRTGARKFWSTGRWCLERRQDAMWTPPSRQACEAWAEVIIALCASHATHLQRCGSSRPAAALATTTAGHARLPLPWLEEPSRRCGSEGPGRTDRFVSATAGPLMLRVSDSLKSLPKSPGRYVYAPIVAQNRRRQEGGASAPQGSTLSWLSLHQAASSSVKSAPPPATAECTRPSS